ncbi:MAG TPA: PorV/PorQ family protein, partial [bacterium]|nr:PorV/PorQ family protein [bacterium]
HLSYADKFKLFNKFAKYGIGAKLIHQKIDKESAQGIAFDLGMQYDFNEDFSAGALIQNFGRLSKFESENDKMPLNLKLGVSYKFFDDRFLTALDVNIPNDNEIYANLGVELFVLPKNYDFNFGVRAGYNGIESDRKGYSVGLGFNLMNFDLDYAFLPFTELGNTHRFSLNYLFGKRTEPKLKIQEQKKNAELEALIKIMQLSKPALTSLPDKKDAEIKPSQYPVFQGYSVDAATTESNEKYDKPENVKVVPPPVSIEKKIPPVEFILSSIKRDYPIEPEKYSQEKSSGLKLTEEEFALKQLLKNGYSRIIYFQSRSAKSVFITGSFNDWRREPLTYDFVSGVWFCELNIPAGRYFYKFIVDGKIIPDANNIHFQLDGIEGINSILYLDFTE